MFAHLVDDTAVPYHPSGDDNRFAFLWRYYSILMSITDFIWQAITLPSSVDTRLCVLAEYLLWIWIYPSFMYGDEPPFRPLAISVYHTWQCTSCPSLRHDTKGRAMKPPKPSTVDTRPLKSKSMSDKRTNILCRMSARLYLNLQSKIANQLSDLQQPIDTAWHRRISGNTKQSIPTTNNYSTNNEQSRKPPKTTQSNNQRCQQ